MRRGLVCAVALSLAMAAHNAFAQEKGAIGLNFSVGEEVAVGATLHLTNGFVMRPQISYDHEERSYCTYYYYYSSCGERSSNLYGLDLGLLFNVAKIESLAVYLGADLEYNRFNWRGNSYQTGVSALFGLRYLVGRRIGLYGEAGAQWLRAHEPPGSHETLDRYGTFTSALGAVLYFK